MIRVLVVDDDFMVAKVHAAFVARTPVSRSWGW
jgi:response regulator of citrate/malate metabolism